MQSAVRINYSPKVGAECQKIQKVHHYSVVTDGIVGGLGEQINVELKQETNISLLTYKRIHDWVK